MRFINVTNNDKAKVLCYGAVQTVVDLASFRPDSEMVRAFKFNPAGGQGVEPKYDYPDGQIPKDDTVSPAIVALRSGRLDKADAEKVKRAVIDDAKRMNDKVKAEKVEKSLSKTLGLDVAETQQKETQQK